MLNGHILGDETIESGIVLEHIALGVDVPSVNERLMHRRRPLRRGGGGSHVKKESLLVCSIEFDWVRII